MFLAREASACTQTSSIRHATRTPTRRQTLLLFALLSLTSAALSLPSPLHTHRLRTPIPDATTRCLSSRGPLPPPVALPPQHQHGWLPRPLWEIGSKPQKQQQQGRCIPAAHAPESGFPMLDSLRAMTRHARLFREGSCRSYRDRCFRHHPCLGASPRRLGQARCQGRRCETRGWQRREHLRLRGQGQVGRARAPRLADSAQHRDVQQHHVPLL